MLTGDTDIDLKHVEFIHFAIKKLEKLDRSSNQMFVQTMTVLYMCGVRQIKLANHTGIDQGRLSSWYKKRDASCKTTSRSDLNTKLLEFLKIHEASLSRKIEYFRIRPAA